jgi:hypothetical protein
MITKRDKNESSRDWRIRGTRGERRDTSHEITALSNAETSGNSIAMSLYTFIARYWQSTAVTTEYLVQLWGKIKSCISLQHEEQCPECLLLVAIPSSSRLSSYMLADNISSFTGLIVKWLWVKPHYATEYSRCFYLYFYRNMFRPIWWPSSSESYKIRVLKEVAISTTGP